MVFGEKVIDLAAIKKRLEEATPGPWNHHKYPDVKTWTVAQRESVASKIRTQQDADFIAHAPTDIANLLAALEKCKEAMKSAAFCLSKNSAHKFEIEEDLEKTLKEIFGGETK